MIRTPSRSSEGALDAPERGVRRRRWRFPIGWRVSIGFGVFAVAVGLLFGLTRLALEENQRLAREIEEVYAPGIQVLAGLEGTVALVVSDLEAWVEGNSEDAARLEAQLEDRVQRELPEQMARAEHLTSLMDDEAVLQWERIRADLDLVSIVYAEVRYRLADGPVAPDSAEWARAREYVKGADNLPAYVARFQKDLDGLMAHQLEALTGSTGRLQEVGVLLGRNAGRIALVVFVLGVLISLAVTRSITRPIRICVGHCCTWVGVCNPSVRCR